LHFLTKICSPQYITKGRQPTKPLVRLEHTTLNMANPHSKSWLTQQRVKERKNFRLLDSSQSLEEQNFYQGLPCPYDHVIRDQTHQWCYQCVMKIQTGLCGLDVNYIHEDFSAYALKALEMVDIGKPTDCWPVNKFDRSGKPKRISFPDYRQNGKEIVASKVTIKKIMYTLFWGDIGKEVVTNLPGCTDPTCCNPLHLTTIYNRDVKPRKMFNYFDLQRDEKKINLLLNRHLKGYRIEDLLLQSYKPTIAAI
jgi:hypothetical protein